MANTSDEPLPRAYLIPIEAGLSSSNQLLVRTRWLAAAGVLAAACVLAVAGQGVSALAAAAVGLLILVYNRSAVRQLRTLQSVPVPDVSSHVRFVNQQIAADWLALTMLVTWTGGTGSPLIFIYFIHVVLASILLPSRWALWQVLFGIGLVTAVTAAEWADLFPGVLYNAAVWARPPDPGLQWLRFGLFVGSLFATQQITTRIAASLRQREREQAVLQRELRNQIDRVHGLAHRAHEINQTLDEETVFDTLMAAVSSMLPVDGCALSMLDGETQQLQLKTQIDLPPSYVRRGPVPVSESPLDEWALSGHPIHVPDLRLEPRIVYRDDLIAEGFQSLLAVPVTAQNQPVGLITIYSREKHKFTAEDIELVRTLADISASAMKNARQFKEMRALERSKSEMLWTVTHELRSPLAAVHSLLTLIIEGYAGDAPQQLRTMVARAVSRTEALLETVNDLLALAKGRLTPVDADAEPLDLCELLDDAVALFSPQAQQKNVALQVERDACPLPVKMIREEGERLLSNLLSNAVKYTPEGGRVSVALSCTGDTIRLVVEDTGIGIPKAAQARVFDGFYRARNARAIKTDGTGLGLAIVRRITEKYAGKMELVSDTGQGATFTVTLPRAVEQGPEAGAGRPKASRP